MSLADTSGRPYGACMRFPPTSRPLRWAVACAVGFAVAVPVARRVVAPTTVAAVVDGDTVRLADGRRVRLVQVDTPEVHGRVDCWGPEASALTKRLLPPGTPVVVRPAADPYDRFGRLLADVYRTADGLWVNRALIDRGAARVLVIGPNTANADLFDRLEADARRAGRGLWGACGGP